MTQTRHFKHVLVANRHVVHNDAVVQLRHDSDFDVASDAALLHGDGLLGDHVGRALAHQAQLLLQQVREACPRGARCVLVQDDVPAEAHWKTND